MAFGSTPKDSSGIPIASVYVPGDTFRALQGAPSGSADGSNNISTSALMTLSGPPATDPYQVSVFAGGSLRVQEGETQLFQEGFDTSTLDTTNRWKSPTAAGGGVAATNALTNTVLQTGTTANGYSYLESQPSFPPVNPGWLLFYTGVNLPFPTVVNQYFAWGLGTSPTTPTAATPLTNACVFEVNTDGKMYAATYQSGTRRVVQDLSTTGNSKQPQDASVHKYYIYYKGDNIFWCIDGPDLVVASTPTGVLGPDVNILPIKFTAIAGSVAPLSSGSLTVNTVNLADTSRNNLQISDATYPWRQAAVDGLGNLSVKIGGGAQATAIAAGAAGPTVIKSSAGVVYGVLLTSSAAGVPTIFDNASAASGKIVDIIAGGAAIGTLSSLPAGGVSCANGITALGGATMPAMTVFWN